MKRRLILLIVSLLRILRGEVSTNSLIKRGLKVGANFSRQGGVRIDTSYCFLIEIGDNVTLAPNVHILAHDASLKMFLGISRIGRVIVGNNVFIGAGSIILPNVKIGDDVIIGAGSIVTKNVPGNSVFAGNPARKVCSLIELKEKNFDLLKSGPLFDRTYNTLDINDSSKQEMIEQLSNGVGFLKCDNFDKIKYSSSEE